MPRIRSIKPEFWQDQKLARQPSDVRLTFICLWSMADDEGRIEADAESVQHFGFPREDSRKVARALDTLADLGRILRYEVDGTKYISVIHFNKHQKIDKPSASKLPAPPRVTADSPKPREGSTKHREESTTDQGSGIMDQGGDHGSLLSSADADPEPTHPTLPPLALVWNEVAVPAGLPAVTKVVGKRAKAIAAAVRDEPNLETWRMAFVAVTESAHHSGNNDRRWKADLDFVLRDDQRSKWLDAAGQARRCPAGGCPNQGTIEMGEGSGWWYCKEHAHPGVGT